jgi:hypothetical protein
MNPLIESLRRERFYMDKGNLSWRFYSKKCEYILPICDYIEVAQRPNYEDFVANPLNPGFRERFEEHDRALAAVESSASKFADGLIQSDLFQKQVKDSLERYESDALANRQYPDLASMRESLPRVVAEYLVNRVDVLPHHYMTHEFWEKYKNEFWEKYKNQFEPYQGRQPFQAAQKAAGELKDVSSKLLLDLENHRQLLCGAYDIPAAPILIDKSHSVDAFIA